MSHFPPPPETPPKVGLFRRVPPAIFPPILGLLGLVAAWRRAVQVFDFPAPPVDMLAGAVSLLFLFAAGAYSGKLILRPSVLPEDLATLPGRIGLAAFCVSLLVISSILGPFAPGLSQAGVIAALILLAGLALFVAAQFVTNREAFGPLTPALHLVFVGVVVGPVAAVPLGLLPWLVPALVWYSVAAALIVTGLTAGPLLGRSSPAPLRPLQAIHLAPPAFLCIDGFLIAAPALAWSALVWATAIFILLVMRARWLTEAGFSPFWSAFTFPLTAFAAALLLGAEASAQPLLEVGGALVLVTATFIVPAVAYRIVKLWATGMLAARSNAAIA